MGMFVAKMADKLKDGELGGAGFVSPIFGYINSRQRKNDKLLLLLLVLVVLAMLVLPLLEVIIPQGLSRPK